MSSIHLQRMNFDAVKLSVEICLVSHDRYQFIVFYLLLRVFVLWILIPFSHIRAAIAACGFLVPFLQHWFCLAKH